MALGKLRQEYGCRLKASLGYRVRSCLKRRKEVKIKDEKPGKQLIVNFSVSVVLQGLLGGIPVSDLKQAKLG